MYEKRPDDFAGFWENIASINIVALDNEDEEKAMAPLIADLSSRAAHSISHFHHCLCWALFDIDGHQWAKEAGESRGSDDGFLYARCYVVAKGKEYYDAVHDNPTLMPKTCAQWAESIISVAVDAWREIGKDEEVFYETIRNMVSYETCSNEKFWPHLR